MSSLIVFVFIAISQNTFGLEIPKRKWLSRAVGSLFVLLIAVSCLFLYSLQLKGFFDSLAIIHLINLIITVFREEFVLRGIIQTFAAQRLKGSIIHISHAIWISTAAFSLWHLVNLSFWPWQLVIQQMIVCIPSGIVFGLIREKTNNTLITFLLHIICDLFFLSAYVLILGKLFFRLF